MRPSRSTYLGFLYKLRILSDRKAVGRAQRAARLLFCTPTLPRCFRHGSNDMNACDEHFLRAITLVLRLAVHKVLKEGAETGGGRTDSHRNHNYHPLLSVAKLSLTIILGFELGEKVSPGLTPRPSSCKAFLLNGLCASLHPDTAHGEQSR